MDGRLRLILSAVYMACERGICRQRLVAFSASEPGLVQSFCRDITDGGPGPRPAQGQSRQALPPKANFEWCVQPRVCPGRTCSQPRLREGAKIEKLLEPQKDGIVKVC